MNHELRKLKVLFICRTFAKFPFMSFRTCLPRRGGGYGIQIVWIPDIEALHFRFENDSEVQKSYRCLCERQRTLNNSSNRHCEELASDEAISGIRILNSKNNNKILIFKTSDFRLLKYVIANINEPARHLPGIAGRGILGIRILNSKNNNKILIFKTSDFRLLKYVITNINEPARHLPGIAGGGIP